MSKSHGPTKPGLRLVPSPLYVTVGDIQCRLLHDQPISLPTGLLDLDDGRLSRSQSPEGPATGHLEPGFLGFPGS